MAMLCTLISASAYDFEVDGIYYNILSLEDLTCEVTYNAKNKSETTRYFYWYKRQSGSDYDASSLITTYPSYSGELTIPSTVNYKGRKLGSSRNYSAYIVGSSCG